MGVSLAPNQPSLAECPLPRASSFAAHSNCPRTTDMSHWTVVCRTDVVCSKSSRSSGGCTPSNVPTGAVPARRRGDHRQLSALAAADRAGLPRRHGVEGWLGAGDGGVAGHRLRHLPSWALGRGALGGEKGLEGQKMGHFLREDVVRIFWQSLLLEFLNMTLVAEPSWPQTPHRPPATSPPLCLALLKLPRTCSACKYRRGERCCPRGNFPSCRE